MSTYYSKLLELRKIQNKNDKYFLTVNFSFKETIEMFWEIDEYTAKNLEDMVQFDEMYKYRLSFKTSYDNLNQQYLSVLTKTYKETSKILNFSCSEDYIKQLTAIKNIKDINDVDRLSFISINPYLVNSNKEKENLYIPSKNKQLKFLPISSAIISIVFIMIFGFLSHNHINKSYFNEKVLAESIHLSTMENQEIISESISYDYIDEKINQNLEKDNEIIVDALSSIEDNIPFIVLEDTITYGLPEGKVAITFDDGPSKYSMEIVDILKKYDVGGTFFLTGYNVKKYPNCVKYIQSNGFSIGSHSINHLNMSKLSYEKLKDEIIGSIEMLNEITNDNIFLFRPPYGSYNNQLVDLVNENQYKIVLWNNDPEDWKTRDAEKIFKAIKNSNVSGSIIVLHESQAVVDSLPNIIEYLQDLNLEIVSLK